MQHFSPPDDQSVRLNVLVGQTAILISSILAAIIVLVGLLWEVIGSPDMATRADSHLSLFDAQQSITNWFQTSMLFLSAFLCLVTAGINARSGRIKWGGAAGLLVYLSMDELTNIDHEISITMMALLTGGTYAYFALMGVVACICVGLFVTFRSLVGHSHARPRLLAAGFLIFVAGAVILEVISTLMAMKFGVGSTPHVWSASAEEALETIGVTIFAISMLIHLCFPRALPKRLNH